MPKQPILSEIVLMGDPFWTKGSSYLEIEVVPERSINIDKIKLSVINYIYGLLHNIYSYYNFNL